MVVIAVIEPLPYYLEMGAASRFWKGWQPNLEILAQLCGFCTRTVIIKTWRARKKWRYLPGLAHTDKMGALKPRAFRVDPALYISRFSLTPRDLQDLCRIAHSAHISDLASKLDMSSSSRKSGEERSSWRQPSQRNCGVVRDGKLNFLTTPKTLLAKELSMRSFHSSSNYSLLVPKFA